jgi:hypothetical protein
VSVGWSERHPAVREKCEWLEPNPNLPAGVPATVAHMFRDMRNALLEVLGDGPQFTLSLQHLIDAKDCAVRQGIADGRPPISPA